MSELPSWYPGTEAKPAPMPLLLVQGFVNTRDVETDADLLADLSGGRSWLIDAGLIDAHAPLSESDLEHARRVREGIRALIEEDDDRHAAEPPGAVEPLRAVAAAHRARLTVADDGSIALENAARGELGDGLFELLLIVYGAQDDGTWTRLKICANPDCQWAYFDRSRNQQASWCNMASCGNRLKNRQLRARRR